MPTTYKVAAQLLLDTGQFESGVRRSQGVLGNLRAGLVEMIRQADGGGAALRRMAVDFGVAAAAAASLGAIKLWTRGVQNARAAATGEIELKISASQVGETPQAIGDRMRELKRLAFDTSKDVTGTMGDVQKAFGQALNMGVSVTALKSGAGRAGALLADAEGMDKAGALAMINRLAGNFNVAPEKTGGLADMLLKSRRVSGFTDMDSFAHELTRGAPEIARVGGRPEDAALVLAAVSRVRTEGAGMATGAFFRELLAPEKQKYVKKYGFDKLFENGRFAGTDRMTEVFDRFDAKYKSPAERAGILMKIFGAEGQLVPDAVRKPGFRTLGAERDSKLGLEAALNLKRGTLDYQAEAVGGTLQTGWQELFRPAERWSAKGLGFLGDKIVGPISDQMATNETLQKTVSGGLLGIGLGLAGGAAYFGGRALMTGKKALGGIGGIRGLLTSKMGAGIDLAGGVAVGKALEKAAGVQPVFVVNWPGVLSGRPEASIGTMVQRGLGVPALGAGGTLLGPGGRALLPGPVVGAGMFSKAKMMAPLTGGAALAGGLAVVGATYTAATSIDSATREAWAARDSADAARAREMAVDPKNALAVIRANKIRQAKQFGWSAERLESEIATSSAGLAQQRRQDGGNTGGVFSDWLAGFKTMFGIGQQAADNQFKSAEQLAAAAGDMQLAAANLRASSGPRSAGALDGRGA